ncbi:hypothetical protein L202_02588 [Cryptococcus amylolentus CBS 6039]|uniref:Condensin complex subunit 2 n=1 Tax=Cryptococcus amylolentus CBS 6039 TaxID=1295533 RepID=A0A1E3I129_9TREE|nr:hypothetical protein L202_02588 [Cryptococcus amylolentus CBS 6039]ODN82310.1 hypothetical protein L202_02588 [Cryptococcus amylolentus CBS 6039]
MSKQAGKRARVSLNAHDNPLHRSTSSINDDAAEKAKRRKSAHFPPHLEEDAAAPAKRVVSGLALQQQGINQRRGKRLSAVESSVPVISMEAMNTNFEEWMKLATDNKITANNTWNFALIDYFADLTLLRNGPDDQSINFQKASSTLDGCVKIWTSRVDSVATETGKLLSGLAGGSEDVQDEDGEEGEEEEGAPKATRKTAHSEATLAKSFAQLQVKKLDVEFTVDPLFKKTSADFDEGGAMGLLMNHLGVDDKMRVVFDAGDAGDEEDEEEELEMRDDVIDLDKLLDFIPSVDALEDLKISNTLSSFHFSSDPDSAPDFTTLLGLNDTFQDDEPPFQDEPNPAYDGDEIPMAPMDVGGEEEHDFFGFDDYNAGGGGGEGGFDDDTSMMGDADAAERHGRAINPQPASLGLAGQGDHLGPFDPRTRQARDELVVGLREGDEDGMFDYFDQGFGGKSWAGAEHWKLRKVSRKDPTAPSANAKTTRAAKAPFTIDFSSPATTATSTKTLFAPGTKASLNLPSSSRSKGKNAAKRKEEYLLPDDMHFSSHQLLRLFLKPKFFLRVRRSGGGTQAPLNENGEIDENFWANAAAERAEGDVDNDEFGSAPAPFESQFFQDDDDGYDGGADMPTIMDYDDEPLVTYDENGLPIPVAGADGGEEDLLAETQGMELKRARPETVHFAKKAKRVDVKRLKDDIWSGLKTLIPDGPPPADEDGDAAAADDELDKDKAEPVQTFNNIITSLRTTYPAQKMSDISTSFCFICLLHLANEEGLKIESARKDGKDSEDVGCMGFLGEDGVPSLEDLAKAGRAEGDRKDRVIGELEALKVYKDLAAGRAA